MHISELMAARGQFISLEFFPPKDPDTWPAFFEEVRQLKALDPLFVSVTYGAGGSTQAHTLEIVTVMKRGLGLEPMAHLTCVGADRDKLGEFLGGLSKAGVDNVLALRGDPPKGADHFTPTSEEFRHASDLVRFIRANYCKMGIGVAAYPEKHPEAPSLDEDVARLAQKLQAGSDFAVTQLFFDPSVYFSFVVKAREQGVANPIIPGVLPIMSLASLKRILSFCAASIPASFKAEIEEADARSGPDAVKEIGIEYARRQVQALLDGGAPGVHLYTLNKAEACLAVAKGL